MLFSCAVLTNLRSFAINMLFDVPWILAGAKYKIGNFDKKFKFTNF